MDTAKSVRRFCWFGPNGVLGTQLAPRMFKVWPESTGFGRNRAANSRASANRIFSLSAAGSRLPWAACSKVTFKREVVGRPSAIAGMAIAGRANSTGARFCFTLPAWMDAGKGASCSAGRFKRANPVADALSQPVDEEPDGSARKIEVSNEDWKRPVDEDARIARMKSQHALGARWLSRKTNYKASADQRGTAIGSKPGPRSLRDQRPSSEGWKR